MDHISIVFILKNAVSVNFDKIWKLLIFYTITITLITVLHFYSLGAAAINAPALELLKHIEYLNDQVRSSVTSTYAVEVYYFYL